MVFKAFRPFFPTIEKTASFYALYNDGATGKYTAKITKQSIGEKLLNEYLSDIVKVSISIFEQDEFQLVISTNASISIKCNENDFYSILENIKNKIYG